MDSEESNATRPGRWPDAVVGVLVQFLLGIAIATGAVPPMVLGVQARGAETIGIVVLLIATACSAFSIRDSLGSGDLDKREYMVIVLAPIITRLDLGLLLWTNVNKALVWAEQVVYMEEAEAQSNELLSLASLSWHDGEDRMLDAEFGKWGGDAAALMYRMLEAFNPKLARSNIAAFLGHVTLWPIALALFLALQVVSVVGWCLLWGLAKLARLTGRRSKAVYIKRTSLLTFMFHRRQVQKNALYMRPEVTWLADSQMNKVRGDKRRFRFRWAMLAGVDARARHPHFERLFEISYPMRATLVLSRARADVTFQDVELVLNREWILFPGLISEPLTKIGHQASRQVVLYRVVAWPEIDEPSREVVRRTKSFVQSNISRWTRLQSTLNGVDKALFDTVRVILRRWLVQLVMLVWWDGASEARRAPVQNVVEELASAYTTNLNGIEMAMRILGQRPIWSVSATEEFDMISSLMWSPNQCACWVCTKVAEKGQLPDQRYQQSPNIVDLENDLSRDVGCLKATALCSAWKYGVRSWLRLIYEGDPGPKLAQVVSSAP